MNIKKNLQEKQRERALTCLINLARTLDNKKRYLLSEYQDHNYFGIKDIEHLYNDEIDDYYKSVLARSSFDNN